MILLTSNCFKVWYKCSDNQKKNTADLKFFLVHPEDLIEIKANFSEGKKQMSRIGVNNFWVERAMLYALKYELP